MRLLFLNHNVRYGGTYYRAMPMAEHLALRGHQVTLLTVSPELHWRCRWSSVNGVRVGEMPNVGQNYSGEGYGPLDNLNRLAHAFLHHYDVIHMFDHKPNATLAGFASGRVRGARLVADWADWWGGPGGINDVPKRRVPAVGMFERWWETRSKLWADAVVTISTVLRQRALEVGCRPERVLYLPSGAAVGRIRPVATGEARAALGIPAERRMVGFIGMGQGDLEIVMQALQALPGVWLMVVGHAIARVRVLAESYGVADRLWQTGFVPDDKVSHYLGCADVMCLPLTDRASNRGRLPNKLLDYMCAGRATVACPVGDVAAIVEQHGCGILAQPDGFASAIAELLSDDQRRHEMGRRARTAAETDFSWPNLVERLETLYSALLGHA